MERKPRRQPRPEINVENEPELVCMNPDAEHRLFLPTSWTQERREAVFLSWRRL